MTTTNTSKKANMSTTQTATPRPIAWVIGVYTNPTYPGAWLVMVACPRCGGVHQHGASDLGNLGHRAAHCHTDHRGNGYVLRLTTAEHARELAIAAERCQAITKAGNACRRRRTGELGHACGLHRGHPAAPGLKYQTEPTVTTRESLSTPGTRAECPPALPASEAPPLFWQGSPPPRTQPPFTRTGLKY